MRQFLCVMLFAFPVLAYCQTDRQLIREGNRFYYKKDYTKAEVLYRKAVEKNGENSQAIYNLGLALFMQKKDSAAMVQYEKASKLEKNKTRLAKVYHNIGIILQSHQMYGDAEKAYEQSLRNNPNDDETRYNLVLCKRKNKNQQDKQQQKNQQQKQNKKQQKQDQQQKQERQPQDKQQKMSKENAEQLLNAAIQNEKSTQQRIKKAMQKPKRQTLEKNW